MPKYKIENKIEVIGKVVKKLREKQLTGTLTNEEIKDSIFAMHSFLFPPEKDFYKITLPKNFGDVN